MDFQNDQDLVTVSGTVAGFEWINPHAWPYVAGWGFEMGSPNGLVHNGYAAKNGSNTANARNRHPARRPEAIRGLPEHSRRPRQAVTRSDNPQAFDPLPCTEAH